MRHHRRLGRRYGRAAGGKRYEGVKVDRQYGRLYYVDGNGKVMSTRRKNA